MLYFPTINVILYHVKMLVFYYVQTKALTFVGKKMRYMTNSYSMRNST
jgi:hypothetical protein